MDDNKEVVNADCTELETYRMRRQNDCTCVYCEAFVLGLQIFDLQISTRLEYLRFHQESATKQDHYLYLISSFNVVDKDKRPFNKATGMPKVNKGHSRVTHIISCILIISLSHHFHDDGLTSTRFNKTYYMVNNYINLNS